jgi:hypothetical protein
LKLLLNQPFINQLPKKASRIIFSGDYAATLATAVKKYFEGPLSPGKISEVFRFGSRFLLPTTY